MSHHKQADHVCPPFLGYFLLANPLRRLLYTPRSIVAAHVTEGMTVIEPGPGMGFFTLELARLVGASGRVVALDIQPKMLKVIAQRAEKADLLGLVDLRLIENDSLGINDLKGKADFFLAFAMVHEVPDPRRFFKEAFASLKSAPYWLSPKAMYQSNCIRKNLVTPRPPSFESRVALRSA